MALNLVGIINENEFYTHHYLSAILEGDLKNLFAKWEQLQTEKGIKPPQDRLAGLTRDYFKVRNKLEKAKKPGEILGLQREFFPQLFEALGYSYAPQIISLDSGKALPLIGEIRKRSGEPELWLVDAIVPLQEDADPLETKLSPEQYAGVEADKILSDVSLSDIVTKEVFTLAEPPRWVILLTFSHIILLDRTKWNEKRFLRFDLADIFGRKETTTLKAMAALLVHDSICPEDGLPLLDTLDENSHKHAFSVSEDLKYSAREAVELIANEAVYYFREKLKGSVFGERGGDVVDEKKLTEESLRYLYRLLFLFYIEARPELGYAPMKSEEYRTGYSLENLRGLEMIPLTTDEAQKGYFFHESLQRLFTIIFEGFNHEKTTIAMELGDEAQHHTFRMLPLKSHLFDPARTPFLNRVKFRNPVLQKVIGLLSLTRPGNGRRRGRISYAQLGINQLGAVYEGLLSYSGFFAKTDLYEVKKAEENYNELDTAYFVIAEELSKYEENEKVYTSDGKLKTYPKGTFIYRLAGRNREKSASYYTPEVLTQCLVKYALKELLKDKSADDILKLTVCEPAMGNGSFINEAINQLAEAYLQKKQKETGQTISHDVYAQEKQKVKACLADNNVFGVDLNPTAVELAEVSLWLNSICGDDGSTTTIPWFGNQLVTGNSLIGARRQVFDANLLEENRRGEQTWLDVVPDRVPLNKTRPAKTVYHFLLPDHGMADYNDKVIKSMAKDEIEKIKQWRKKFIKPYRQDEIDTLVRLSESIDKLWTRHAEQCASIRQRTREPYKFFGYDDSGKFTTRLTTQEKDRMFSQELLSENVPNSSPYRRLKLAMDYWCSLWFWPIIDADKLPSRDEYLKDLSLILEGTLYKTVPSDGDQYLLIPDVAPAQQDLDFTNEFGFVNLDKLCEKIERLALVRELGKKYRFHHWELEFADLFVERGGFDLILGNPPWIKIEWNEGGLLGDYEPAFAIRKYTATKLTALREGTLQKYGMRSDYLTEYVNFTGVQNYLNSLQNYPSLKGTQSNLYKCFIPQSWYINRNNGVSGYLHPEGIYDDANGSLLRELVYPLLRYHFQFQNALNLFAEVAHREKYSINIYSNNRTENFYHISNLFHPSTIDQSFQHDGRGICLGLKDDENNWNLGGHKDRIIDVDSERLALFGLLFEGREANPRASRLPVIHSVQVLNVLAKFAANKRLSELNGHFCSLEMWHEVNSQKDGTIKRSTIFPKSTESMILSGPHFFVGNPLYKTPRAICEEKGDYDIIDLTETKDDYLPRTNYSPSLDMATYQKRVPSVTWAKDDLVTNYYRLIFRAMLPPPNERTLIGAIVPKGVGHINLCRSYVFSSSKLREGIIFSAYAFSIPFDFLIKTTGRPILHQTLDEFPLPLNDSFDNKLILRALMLNCLTKYYSELWDICWDMSYRNDQWAKNDVRLRNTKMENLTSHLQRDCSLRTDFERRQALVEIDVLAAMALGLTLEELCTIYRIQFPVLRQNENDTWYDNNGRIVFTCSKGLPGVGFTRSEWNEVKDMANGTVERKITVDTTPDGPRERTLTYVAPFDKCNREQDYATAWAEFERRFK